MQAIIPDETRIQLGPLHEKALGRRSFQRLESAYGGLTDNSDLRRLLSDGQFRLLPIPHAEELSVEHPCFKVIHILSEDLPVKRSLPENGLRTVMTPAFLVVRKDSSGLLVSTVLRSLYTESDLVRRFRLIPLKKAAEWRSWGLHPDADEFFESVQEFVDP